MGGYDSPNVELIAAQEPDMVFISAGVQEEAVQKLEEFGIRVVVLDADTLEQVMNNIRRRGS
jgi:ABC-type Fe3+-hydroxamate transport system substrate-binding protein